MTLSKAAPGPSSAGADPSGLPRLRVGEKPSGAAAAAAPLGGRLRPDALLEPSGL